MCRRTSHNYERGLSIMNYILEDDGHSIAEASIEFRLGKTAIEGDIYYMGQEAFYGNRENAQELKEKYLKVQETLKKVAKRNLAKAKAKKTVSN